MRVLLYAKDADGAGIRLQRVIEAFVLKDRLEVYRDIDNLSRRFRRPKGDVDRIILVLLTTSPQDLQSMVPIQKLLTDVRIIMVLPDRSEDTVKAGHRFLPRFVTYLDNDFVEIGAVLNKMLRYPLPGLPFE